MERTQISLTSEQAHRLRRLARRRRTSMAALIREAIDRVHPDSESDDLEAQWRRALASVGGGHSGHRDISQRHDDYLGDAFGE
jgi:predicted transcriptional regulator